LTKLKGDLRLDRYFFLLVSITASSDVTANMSRMVNDGYSGTIITSCSVC
jgi:hypothetical protein